MTRARVIVAEPEFRSRIASVIRRVLTRPREPAKLAGDVIEMRRRMETHNRPVSVWDVKQVPGGLIDVEFIAQYLMLLHGARHPEILHSNTGKALRTLARLGLIDADNARVLVQAGRLWRGLQGYLRLTTGGGFDEAHASEPLRINLARIGGVQDFAELEKKMADTAERVRATYEKIVLAAASGDVAATKPKPSGGTP